jgi:PAS domain S-box-containing protein
MPKRVRKRPGGEFGSGRARVAIIALILFVITLLATRAATTLVYNASLAQTKERLREYVQAQASAIQSMAALQERIARSLPPSAKRGDPRQWVLDLLSEAHALYRGAGRTGEFNLAEAQGDSIVFLLRHRRGNVTISDSRPVHAGQRTPMQFALEGKSGTMVGADERGVKVVAAYEPVKAYGWGAVAKIDFAEVREPFGQAGLAGSLIALLLIITGTWLVFRVTDPIFNHIVESEERFRGAFESAAVGISLVTPDGMLLRANETLGRMLGYTLKELQSTDFSALVHPDDKAESSRLIRSTVAAERGTFDVELRLVRKDGGQVWARITSALLRDGEGRPTYFVTVVQDVTVRRQAEEELRKSRALLQGVIDNDLVMVYALDRDGRFILANRKMEKLLSSGPGGLVGQTREAVMPLAAAEQQRENDDEVIKTGRLVVFEEESDEPDGKRFYLSVKSPLRDTDGQTVAVAGVSIDITARKRAETALRESEQRFRSLFQGVPVGISVAGMDGSVLAANPAMEQITGFAFDEFGAYALTAMFVDPHDGQEFLRWLRARGRVSDYETRLRRKDGRVFVALLTADKTELGGRPAILTTVRDVTALKAAQNEVLALNRELEQRVAVRTAQLEAANKELESFSYSVSHDLRAPLRAIGGFSRILMEEHAPHLNQEVQRCLTVVHDSAQRMDTLITDLLAFARSAKQSLVKQPVAPRELVDSVLEDLKPEIQERSVELTIGELPPCEADRTLLRQVWANLLSNALKFTRGRRPARIEVGSESRDGGVVYYIRDNGTGFDMQYYDKLFGVFQRLHRPDEFEGSGIGLAIVQRIVGRHGGRVWAEGELGKGAAFYFTLQSETR